MSDKHSGSIRLRWLNTVLRGVSGNSRDGDKLPKLCSATLIEIGIAIAGCEKKKKAGNVHFLCLVQVTRIYIAVEETLLGFVLASKRVPRCKEDALLYKRMDFCAKSYNLTVRSVQTHRSL